MTTASERTNTQVITRGKRLDDLVSSIDSVTIQGDPSRLIQSISYDSRSVLPGSLFVALRGGYTDGHDYLSDARSRGAVACIIDRPVSGIDQLNFHSVVSVADSRQALAQVSRDFFDDPSAAFRLIGVTGTDGKTTTCHILDQILKMAGKRTALVGTVAIRIGDQPPRSPGRQTTPESLETQRLLAEMRDDAIEVGILETSSHGLETHRVDGCLFDIGIITNITHEHLDFHGTVEQYRAAKAKLLRHVATARDRGKLGVSVINVDDPGARSILPLAQGTTIVTYSERSDSGARVHADQILATQGGYAFRLCLRGAGVDVDLPLIGRWNISNTLAAAAAADALEVPVDVIAASIANLTGVPGRMQPIRQGQPFLVIVDYAHTAPALELVLDAARESARGNVLVLFGSAGERDIEKRAEMGAIAVRTADYAVFTSEDPRFEPPDEIINMIAAGAVQYGGVEGVDFDRIEDRGAAIDHMLRKARAGDVVVLAGKGHERSIIYGADERPWNESEIARDTLQDLGYTGVE